MKIRVQAQAMSLTANLFVLTSKNNKRLTYTNRSGSFNQLIGKSNQTAASAQQVNAANPA